MKNQLENKEIFKNVKEEVTISICTLKDNKLCLAVDTPGARIHQSEGDNIKELIIKGDHIRQNYLRDNSLEFNLKKSKDFQLLPKLYPAELFEEYIYKLEVQNEISCCRVLIVRSNFKRVYNHLESSLSIGIFDEVDKVVLERSQAFIKNVKDWNDLKTIVKAITGQNI